MIHMYRKLNDDIFARCLVTMRNVVIITRDSEVIMFSPCVFVCLCVWLSMFVTMFVRTI